MSGNTGQSGREYYLYALYRTRKINRKTNKFCLVTFNEITICFTDVGVYLMFLSNPSWLLRNTKRHWKKVNSQLSVYWQVIFLQNIFINYLDLPGKRGSDLWPLHICLSFLIHFLTSKPSGLWAKLLYICYSQYCDLFCHSLCHS